MAGISSYQNEENLGQVIWEFLPGILKFLSFIALIAVLIVGGQAFLQATDKAEGYVFQADLIRSNTPIYGNRDSGIVVVLASDFQCPACGAYDSIFTKVREDYKDRVTFIFKDYPLYTIHPYAEDLAKAGQAANKQGKFIEFSDLAFANQDALVSEGTDILPIWASQIEGLNVDQWNMDRNSGEISKQVEYSQEDMNQISLPKTPNSRGLSKPSGETLGTPTTIIMQGESVLDWWTGAIDEETIRKAIDAQLNK